MPGAARQAGQTETPALAAHVEQDAQIGLLRRDPRQGETQTGVAGGLPARGLAIGPLPGDVRPGVILAGTAGQETPPPQARVTLAQRHQPRDESAHGVLGRDLGPVEPAHRVVLTPGIVIAALGAQHLVTRQDHGYPLAEEKDGHEVAGLAPAQGENGLVLGLALGPAVPAQVLVAAIPGGLAVGLVVFAAITDQVPEGEAVMAGDEVDAVDRQAVVGLIEVAAARDAAGHLADEAAVAPDEAPHAVAIAAVPLHPAVTGKGPDLVETGGVPGLGDDLGVGQNVGKLDAPEQGRIVQGLAILPPRQGASQIEAKAIHVHGPHPVLQAIDDEARHQGVVGVEGIAAAGEVQIATLVDAVEQVKGLVAKALEIEDRPIGPALSRVIEDHVQNDADARPMQGLDHVPEFIAMGPGLGADAIARVRGIEAVGAVAPKIAQAQIPHALGYILVIEGHDRHQLDMGDAEGLEVGDLFDQPQKGARVPHARGGMTGEATDVQLVDDHLLRRQARGGVALPVIVVANDHGAGGVMGHDALPQAAPAIPARLVDCPRAGVQEFHPGIEAQPPTPRIVGPLHAPGEMGADGQPHHQQVPGEEGVIDLGVQADDLEGFRAVMARVQEEFDAGGVAAEDREIDPLGFQARPRGITSAR